MFKSFIVSPDPEFKPAISRTRFSTPIPRGLHGGSERTRQADNEPDSIEQAQNPTRTETPFGKKLVPLGRLVRHERVPADNGETTRFESESQAFSIAVCCGNGNLLIRTLSVLIFW